MQYKIKFPLTSGQNGKTSGKKCDYSLKNKQVYLSFTCVKPQN